MHLKNQNNEYAAKLGALFDEAPKAVIAAIAVSALTQGGDFIDNAKYRFAKEWEALNMAGIVPQKPGKLAKQEIANS